MARKGLSTGAWAFLGLLVVALVIGVSVAGMASIFAEDAVDHNGEFGEFLDPDEVSGTDLNLTDQSINDSGIVEDGNVLTEYAINETNAGNTHHFAWGFSVTGDNGFSSMSVGGGLASGVTTTEITIEEAYIVPDEDGNSLSSDDASYIVNTDDEDTLDASLGEVPEGDYVFNAEMQSQSVSTIGDDVDILNVDLDGASDKDDPSDELHVTVDDVPKAERTS